MIAPFNSKFILPAKDLRCLSVLFAINESPESSQSEIGEKTNLSSSMVNNYIKSFKHKGLVTVTGATNRTQCYFLTEKGKNELFRLLMSYSTEIVQLYSGVKHQLSLILKDFEEEGVKTVVLFGASETAEIVYAAIKATKLEVTGIVDSSSRKQGQSFNGFVIKKPEKIKQLNPDGVVITSFAFQEEIYGDIKKIVDSSVKIKKLSTL